MCDLQTLKKYLTRPSPPRAANDPNCRGKIFSGNDGELWESKPTATGVYRWIKVAPSAKPKSPKSSSKSSSKSSGFEQHTVVELKEMAQVRGLKGYSKLRKAELIELLTMH